MSFFSEVAKKAGLSEINLSSGFNVINYNGEAVYIEGIKRLLKVDGEEIGVELKGAVLTLRGTDLSIFELSDAAIIKGRVGAMDFVKTENKGKGNRHENKKRK